MDRDLGRILPRSRWESRWDPGEILAAGIFLPSRNLAMIPARFSLGSEIRGGKNLARIVLRISPSFSLGSKKSHRDPSTNLAKILAEKQKSQWPKSQHDPTVKLTKILAEKQIHGGKKLGAILPGISPTGLSVGF